MGLVLFAVGEAHAHPDLVRVELETPIPALPSYLTIHKDLRKVPRIRAFSAVFESVFAAHRATQAQAQAQVETQHRARRQKPRRSGPPIVSTNRPEGTYDEGVERRHAIAALWGYLLVSVGAFALLWAYEATDDYAGWVPVLVVVALPAVLAILSAPLRPRHWHAAAIALPAGCFAGGAVVSAAALGGKLVGLSPRVGWDLLAIVVLGGPVLSLGAAIGLWRHLRGRPLRTGAAGVVKLVASLGAGALVLMPLWPELGIGGALALAWALALALALLAKPNAAA